MKKRKNIILIILFFFDMTASFQIGENWIFIEFIDLHFNQRRPWAGAGCAPAQGPIF